MTQLDSTINKIELYPDKNQSRMKNILGQLFKHRHPYLFISPFFIFFAIFGLYPVVFSFYLSFHRWNGVGEARFIGLDNFERMLKDKIFIQSFENSVIIFALYVPLMIFLALFIAVLLNSPKVRGFRIFRTIIFMPFITNMIAAGFAFQIMFNTNYGLINVTLDNLGLGKVGWLDTPETARISLAIVIVWAWLGYNTVLMLAGLQTISSDLSEAARVDGANHYQVFFYITIPLMRPIILFAIVMSTMGTFGLFAEVDALTGGGPSNATITPLIKIYGNAFSQFQFGYASAMSYVYFLVIFGLTMIQLRLFRSEEN
ncbi:MAG: sugar ABC transporter permease [Aggregatilineales bacterium]